jgi:flagellar biosynthesis/type III secretory pathway M-ring protein FliF/YscJ
LNLLLSIAAAAVVVIVVVLMLLVVILRKRTKKLKPAAKQSAGQPEAPAPEKKPETGQDFNI